MKFYQWYYDKYEKVEFIATTIVRKSDRSDRFGWSIGSYKGDELEPDWIMVSTIDPKIAIRAMISLNKKETEKEKKKMISSLFEMKNED